MKNLGHPRNIGYLGEAYVTCLLPGSVHLNKDRDAWKKWDVEWRDIKIDVKTTLSAKQVPVFFGINVNEDLIFLCANLSDTTNPRFYLRHTVQGWKSTFTREIPLTISELPQALLDCHKKYSPMYNKTVDKQQSEVYIRR